MVLLLIPLVTGLVTVVATIVGIIWIFCLAIQDTAKEHNRGRRPRPSIPGFYVPRWGAYRRGSTAREHARWVEDFERALPR